MGIIYKDNAADGKEEDMKSSLLRSKWNKSTNPKSITIESQQK